MYYHRNHQKKKYCWFVRAIALLIAQVFFIEAAVAVPAGVWNREWKGTHADSRTSSLALHSFLQKVSFADKRELFTFQECVQIVTVLMSQGETTAFGMRWSIESGGLDIRGVPAYDRLTDGSLRRFLSWFARDVIEAHSGLPEPYRRRFADRIDAPEEHAYPWHVLGISSHSLEFLRCYETVIPRYIVAWGLFRPVFGHLAEEIDGIEKGELLKLVAFFHDLGKYAKGIAEYGPDGEPIQFDFTGHEELSERLILDPEGKIYEFLRDVCGLTTRQIGYVARCAGLHYQLADIRDAAYASGRGYTRDFVGSQEFFDAVKGTFARVPGFEIEICIFYLADSLAKLGREHIPAATGVDAIVAEIEERLGVLEEAGEVPVWAPALRQMPVNIAAVERALGIAVERLSEPSLNTGFEELLQQL